MERLGKRQRVAQSHWEGNPQSVPLVSIKKSDVPVYLQSGVFFRSLSEEDEETPFDVPQNTLKADKSIGDAADLDHLLCSLRFWGVDDIYPAVVEFGLIRENWQNARAVLDYYTPFFSYLEAFEVRHGHPTKSVLFPAVYLGELQLLKYLYETRHKVLKSDGVEAATQGHLHCLEYLVSRGCRCSGSTLVAAAASGSVACLQYVHRQNSSGWEPVTWIGPVNKSNIDCFIYAYHHLQPTFKCDRDSLANAMLYNGIESINCGIKHGLPLFADLFIRASYVSSNIEAFKHLHSVGCPWPDNMCTWLCQAPKGGFVEFLRFAHHHGCPWNPREVIETAALSGEVKCFQYAHEQGCPWDVSVSVAAVRAHSLRCIKYAHKHNCPWDATTCAAAGRNLATLKYLHEIGCPWSVEAFSGVSRTKACIKYMEKQGFPVIRSE